MDDLTAYFDNPDNPAVGEWLVSAFKTHVIEGGSMDELLGLVSVGFNAPSARTTYSRHKREVAITLAWDILCIDKPDWSEWKCSSELYRKINDNHNTGLVIDEIKICNSMLGSEYSSVDSLHAVTCRSNTARLELISELLDTRLEP